MTKNVTAQTESSSYRDRVGRVFHVGDEVHRALSAAGLDDWLALASTKFFSDAVEQGRIVATSQDEPRVESVDSILPGAVASLHHARIPFVSYPYEWTFGMLRDAALLHLELLEDALAEELILKDASAYNIQWAGASPVFIDVGSFTALRKGDAWAAYGQFCSHFLFPLMLTAYRGIGFQPWLRSNLEGIPSEEFAAMMSLRDLLRPGVFAHGYLQARLGATTGERSTKVRSELRDAGYSTGIVRSNVSRLRKILQKLEWKPNRLDWIDYGTECHYDEPSRLAKLAFVERAVGATRRRLSWDIGANTGAYSRAIARFSDLVVAIDADHASVERLYGDLVSEGCRNVLPLVADVVNPSPDQGWCGRERLSLERREQPDFVSFLGLIHHLALTRNVPLGEIVTWLSRLGPELVVEFVEPEDPMAGKLLANDSGIVNGGAGYDLRSFEELVKKDFRVLDLCRLPMGTRTLFWLRSQRF